MKTFVNENLKRIDFLDERWYEVGDNTGIYVPSVTEIISNGYPTGRGLLQWIKANGFNADIISDKAKARGSRVHEGIDAINKGLLVTWQDEHGNALFDKGEWEMILRYREFIANNNVILLTSEYKFANEELGYGGTIDQVLHFPDTGVTMIVDCKTGNEYRSHALQLAAYMDAWNKEKQVVKNKLIATECAVLYLESQTRGESRDGSKIQGKGWKLQPVTDMDYHRQVFAAAHLLWKDNPDTAKKPSLFSYPSEIDGRQIKDIIEERKSHLLQ